MMTGKVDPRRRCLISLEVHGPAGQSEMIEFQVDTGFSGALLFPQEVAVRLGLVQSNVVDIRLADGSRVQVPRYVAVVVWDGVERTIALPASGQQPLLGTALLDGHRLNAEIQPGRAVTIESLP